MYWAFAGLQRMCRSAQRRQRQGRNLAHDVTQIEVRVGDRLHVFAAHVADVSLVTGDHVRLLALE